MEEFIMNFNSCSSACLLCWSVGWVGLGWFVCLFVHMNAHTELFGRNDDDCANLS